MHLIMPHVVFSFKICPKLWNGQYFWTVQANCDPLGLAQVGLINTLLLGTTFAGFTPLLEHQSPLFNDFEMFFGVKQHS
jgi:hypothetical protein